MKIRVRELRQLIREATEGTLLPTSETLTNIQQELIMMELAAEKPGSPAEDLHLAKFLGSATHSLEQAIQHVQRKKTPRVNK